jgi:hypothetical protein
VLKRFPRLRLLPLNAPLPRLPKLLQRNSADNFRELLLRLHSSGKRTALDKR